MFGRLRFKISPWAADHLRQTIANCEVIKVAPSDHTYSGLLVSICPSSLKGNSAGVENAVVTVLLVLAGCHIAISTPNKGETTSLNLLDDPTLKVTVTRRPAFRMPMVRRDNHKRLGVGYLYLGDEGSAFIVRWLGLASS